MSVDPDRDSESAGQTEVSDLDAAILVDQEVLGLHVAVQNSPLVAEQDALQELVEVALGQPGVHLAVLGDVGVHVLLEVHRQELKYEVELGLLHQHILKNGNNFDHQMMSYERYLEPHYVGVLQLLQQGDLSDGRTGHSLVLRLQSDLLHGHDLSCLGVLTW